MKVKDIIPASKPRNFVAKNQKTAGAGAHKDKKKAEKQGYEKHKGRSVEEAFDDLRDALLSVLQTIYDGAVSGEDMIDTLADEFNQYYDDVEQSGDETLQQAYHHMMDNGQEAEDEPMLMAKIAKEAIAIINQEEGSVMEYETHRWTDEYGNEWEIDDEGNKELIGRGGSSGRGGYTYRKRFKPSYSKPKGYYFYNVPAGKESDARAAGLRQSKSGKWFDTMTNSVAEKVFGKGRYWEPKN